MVLKTLSTGSHQQNTGHPHSQIDSDNRVHADSVSDDFSVEIIRPSFNIDSYRKLAKFNFQYKLAKISLGYGPTFCQQSLL